MMKGNKFENYELEAAEYELDGIRRKEKIRRKREMRLLDREEYRKKNNTRVTRHEEEDDDFALYEKYGAKAFFA
jgi:hypothetical protein